MNTNKRTLKKSIVVFMLNNKTFLIAVILGIILSFASPRFLTAVNLTNVLRQICVVGIMAIPFTFIIGIGDIDLSVGSIVGIVGIIVSVLMRDAGFSLFAAMTIGMIIGAACGALNAGLISALDLPPFIVTFATQSLLRGIVYISTNMVPINRIPDSLIRMGQGYIGPIPIPVIVMFIVLAICWTISKKTKFGRHIVAMGGNKEAAYHCGINTNRVRLKVFCLLGVCCAVAAVVLTGRTASGQVSAGNGNEMDCITAVVLGGSSFSGGVTNIAGTFWGTLIVGMITNGMNLLGIDSNFQIIAKGLMILIALVIDNASSKIYNKLKK
ncbi:MAG: ABC transporter permease [Lachnospiraceae bacterium]|nr:ABC transporter permease [Lachnospiraceae bacterium]